MKLSELLYNASAVQLLFRGGWIGAVVVYFKKTSEAGGRTVILISIVYNDNSGYVTMMNNSNKLC